MDKNSQETYKRIRTGGSGFYEQKRALVAVWGKEAVQFLDGLITNDMKTLDDGAQMTAAFPNAQGRLLVLVRVLRQGERYLFETEEATHEKVFQNLFRFTFAGDFFVEDLSEQYRYFEIFGPAIGRAPVGPVFGGRSAAGHFVPVGLAEEYRNELLASGAVEITDDVYETIRVEDGTPKYGSDMDDTTIVPELGLEGMISYNKGCYIGQEIIARIHFRGHVAKRLAGLILSEPGATLGSELQTPDGKNAGRITSVTFSPTLGQTVAMAFVRYDYLGEGTQLIAGGVTASVTSLPLVASRSKVEI